MDTNDELLIQKSLEGDKEAFEQLIKKHQDWIYNVAFTFTGDRDEALDITQEVLIKMITKLSLFQGKSNFKTWLYRIVKNHFLNMKRGKHEQDPLTFVKFGQGLDLILDMEVPSKEFGIEAQILVNEAKFSCMKGMLLCLERDQRLIYIIGELFEFPDTVGAEIMDISRENFRVKLHRAKQQLYNFMNSKCGLVNKANPCRCARKTAGFIKAGFVDPVSLHFQKNVISSIEKQLDSKLDNYQNEVEESYRKLYQEHPFLESPDALKRIKELLSSREVRETFNFN